MNFMIDFETRFETRFETSSCYVMIVILATPHLCLLCVFIGQLGVVQNERPITKFNYQGVRSVMNIIQSLRMALSISITPLSSGFFGCGNNDVYYYLGEKF